MSDMTRAAPEKLQNKHLVDPIIKGAMHKPTVYAADGAIDPKVGTAKLTKGSAGAYTLRAPTEAEEGLVLKVISGSAFAHVVTATNLIDDGVTGGAKDTATYAAFVGAAMTLIASDGKWTTLSLKAVTVAAA